MGSIRRSVARGVGHRVVAQLLQVARNLHLQRIFVLTFETEFFGHGFVEIDGRSNNRALYPV